MKPEFVEFMYRYCVVEAIRARKEASLAKMLGNFITAKVWKDWQNYWLMESIAWASK